MSFYVRITAAELVIEENGAFIGEIGDDLGHGEEAGAAVKDEEGDAGGAEAAGFRPDVSVGRGEQAVHGGDGSDFRQGGATGNRGGWRQKKL